jgi:hypothetical protein
MERFEARLRGRIIRIDGGELESDMVEYLMDQAVQELEKLDAQEIDASTNLDYSRDSDMRLPISA